MPEDAKIEEEEVNLDGLDELIEESLPPEDEDQVAAEDKVKEEPAETEEPEEPAKDPADSSEEQKPEPEELTTEDLGEEQKEETPEQRIKFRDKEYTLNDLAADPKLLENLVTAANQQTNYQRLHDEDNQRLQEMQARIAEIEAFKQNQLEQAQAAQEQAEQQRPALTPEQLATAYEPALKGLVKEGWIEEDVAELYPNTAIGVLTMRDELFGRITMLEQAIGKFANFYQTSQDQQQVAQATSVMGQLTSYLSELSKEGEIFAPLADEEQQKEFLTNLRDRLNPPIKMLLDNPEIMREYYIGANHKALLESVQKVKANDDTARQKQRQLAAGEGSSARPASKAPAKVAGEDEGWGDL